MMFCMVVKDRIIADQIQNKLGPSWKIICPGDMLAGIAFDEIFCAVRSDDFLPSEIQSESFKNWVDTVLSCRINDSIKRIIFL